MLDVHFLVFLLVLAGRGSSGDLRADTTGCSYSSTENRYQSTKPLVHPQPNGYNYQRPSAVGKSLAQSPPVAKYLPSQFVPKGTTYSVPSKNSGDSPLDASSSNIFYSNQPKLFNSPETDEPLQTNGFNYQNVFLTPEQYYFLQKYSKLPEFIKLESSLYDGRQPLLKNQLPSTVTNDFSQQSQAVAIESGSNRVSQQFASNIPTNENLPTAHNLTFNYAVKKQITNSPDFLSNTAFNNPQNSYLSQKHSPNQGLHKLQPINTPTQYVSNSILNPKQVPASFQTVNQQPSAYFGDVPQPSYTKDSTRSAPQTFTETGSQSNGYTPALVQRIPNGFVRQNFDARSALPQPNNYGTESLQQPEATTSTAPSRTVFGFQPLSNTKSVAFATNYASPNRVNFVESTDYIQKQSDSFELPTISYLTQSTPTKNTDQAPTPIKSQVPRQPVQQNLIQTPPIFIAQPSQYYSPSAANEHRYELQDHRVSQPYITQLSSTSDEQAAGFATPITASRYFSMRTPHLVYGNPVTDTNNFKPLTEKK